MREKSREISIKLSGVKKMYKLGQIGGGTLQGDLQSWWAKVQGKEDPNTKIGTDQRLTGKTFMALNGIDLTVYKGEALGIIGANGAGKSTMLKLLSRVTAPTEGTIDIYGRIASMLEVGTGFNGELTGRENVYMNGAILGMTKAEIDAKMEDIIEFSEVREFIDTPVKRYSSGMYVKLAFSVAAHLDSEIMIMDEVLAVGDVAFQKKCLTKMREAASQESRTVLYVSHNMSTIRQLCDRCIVLDKGKIVFDGDVEEAIDAYMHTSKDTSISMNYSEYIRPKYIINQKVKILEAEYLNKNNTVFSNNEIMIIHIKWKNLADVNNIGIRFEVLTLDEVPRSTFIVNNVHSGKKDEIANMTALLDISLLKPADYKFFFTLFDKGDYGAGSDIDWVPGLFFEIVDDSSEGLNWRHQKWGYIEMPKPKIYFD